MTSKYLLVNLTLDLLFSLYHILGCIHYKSKIVIAVVLPPSVNFISFKLS